MMGIYRSGCKVPGEYKGIQGNAGECRVMPGECRGMCVGAKCPGNAGECRGMPGERKLVGGKCKGNGGESH